MESFSREDADTILAECSEQVLKEIENVVYMAVVESEKSRISLRKEESEEEELDDNKFVIEVGYKNSSLSAITDKEVDEYIKSTSVYLKYIVKKTNKLFVFPFNDDPDLDLFRVVEANSVNQLQYSQRIRPVTCGFGVSNLNSYSAGSVGCIFHLKGEFGYFLLSNWHVICGLNGKLGDQIIQPGIGDKGLFPDDFVGNLFWYKLDSQLDAAIFRINKYKLIADFIPEIGVPNDYDSAEIGQAVKKFGKETGLTTNGTITSTNVSVKVIGSYADGSMIFKNQILIKGKAFSEEGDSGSVILNKQKNIVGLLFAGDGNDLTFANNTDYIFASRIESYVSETSLIKETIPSIEFLKFFKKNNG